MTPRVVFRPQAEGEVLAARRWYEAQRHGLGEEFTAVVDETLASICANPLAFPRVHGETRRAILRRFPYGIYYRAVADDIVVVAVMHGRRHPRRWQSCG